MSRFRPVVVPLTLALVLGVMVTSASAGGVSFVLVGPAINGVVPTGKLRSTNRSFSRVTPGRSLSRSRM